MTFMERIVAVLARHREARQWTDEAVAADLVASLGLVDAPAAAEPVAAVEPAPAEPAAAAESVAEPAPSEADHHPE